MEIRKPPPDDRIYVIVKNPRTGQSKTFTLYGVTDHQAVAIHLQRLLEGGEYVGAGSAGVDETAAGQR